MSLGGRVKRRSLVVVLAVLGSALGVLSGQRRFADREVQRPRLPVSDGAVMRATSTGPARVQYRLS